MGNFSVLLAQVLRRRLSVSLLATAPLIVFALIPLPAAQAQAIAEDAPAPQISSSSSLFNYNGSTRGGESVIVPQRRNTIPFSRLAVGMKISILGYGVEVGTPLSRKTNLRVSGNFFNTSASFSVASIDIGSELNLRSVGLSLDYFPVPHFGLELSPGVLVYNGNRLTGSASVRGGASFSPGNGDYISSPANPVTGALSIGLDRPAPTFMVGFGNRLPRNGRHWSIPVEVGFAYVGPPTVSLHLTGSVCDRNGTNCRPIPSDVNVLSNIALEAAQIGSDIAPLQVYPIVSIGYSYNFGRSR